MCGISGIVRFDSKEVNEKPLLDMMKAMKHRGPDDQGVFINKNVGLGFVRLSILDLTNVGHQPMCDTKERYYIVFNGEIYNYIELREELKTLNYSFKSNTDTEVLLYSYIEWGESCLDKLNGMFAFVIYDKDTDNLFGARDRYGVKPFYYYKDDSLFVFASDIPPILDTKFIAASANEQVIFDYLAFNRTDQTEETFFKDIFKLQHGHCFTIQNNVFQIKKWYNLKEQVKEAIPFKDEHEYRKSFSDAVGLRLRSDVPVGVCLSGGLDSSAITSILLKDYDKKDINTFSAIYSRGDYGDETEFIDEYNEELKNMHFTKPSAKSLLEDLNDFIKIHSEPIPSLSPYAQYKVMQKAKGKVVVTLDGQGADEQLAGYHYFFGFYFKDLLLQGNINMLCKELIAYKKCHHSIYGYKTFIYFLLPKKLRSNIRINKNSYLDKKFISKYIDSNEVSGNIYGSSSLNDALLDHFEYKLEHLLKWSDRNSMAHSSESRTPFLDYRLVERTLATANSEKIKDGTTKNHTGHSR